MKQRIYCKSNVGVLMNLIFLAKQSPSMYQSSMQCNCMLAHGIYFCALHVDIIVVPLVLKIKTIILLK